MKHFKFGIVLIALAVMGNALQAAIPASERQALIDLYNATNGDNWAVKTGWKTPPLAGDGFAQAGPEIGSGWYGISVPFPFDHVTGINLSANNLVGTLPASIGNLPMLTSLNLRTNTLSGALPTELGNLINLTVLHLYENAFTGSLPSTLGNLIHLTQLKAHTNQLSGSIPASLGTMASLQELNLYSNTLTGALPTELGNLTALQVLDVHANLLSGALPASLGNLTNLKSLLLSGNTLTGAIPTEWGGMTVLEYLYLNNNQVSGSIPSSLGGLTHLIGLKLNDNALTGSIPSSFGGLTSLTALDLSRNQLDGEIPAQMGSMAALQNLALFSNKLEGPIPTSLTGLTNLSTSETAIGFNALYTSDSALIAFLNTKDFDWAATQTIAPTGVTATSLDNAVIMVSWLPISYTGNTGGYRVYIADAPGGPYTFVGQTADKTITSMNVTSLVPGDRYYFVVRTQTNAHAVNPNDVISKNSLEVTTVAWTLVNVHVTGTVLSGASPLAGVAMAGLPGGIVTNASGVYDGTVPADWSGTVTPTLAGHTFVPASRSYSNITTNQTGQNYASAFVSYPDRQALTDLYSATGGASWTNSTGWKTAPLYADGFAMPGTEGTWFGVTVDSGSHRVTHIDLNTNNLTGTFPASVSALTSLQGLNLSHNSLGGSMPGSLGTLTSLHTLYLNHNLLTGSIPAEMGSLTGLQQLWLNNNQLNGTIPTTLGGLTSIQSMSLGSNLLTGSIPTQLGSLTSLQNLYLNSNQLSGTIPTALSTLINLDQLFLDNNLLTGTIPAALGDLTQLHVLTLQANQLSGSLPSALGNLINLTQLTLNSNKLVGPLPTTLTNLVNLDVAHTDFGFNGLYTSDATLISFLTARDPDWSETQTIAPSGITATPLNGANILVSWIPIPYKANTGGYKVYISQTTGGPYTPLGQTADKWATVFPVSGLTPGETYYFVVQTHTDAHLANANAIDSENSTQASATAWTQVAIQVTGTVTLDSAPLAGVVMSGLTGNPTTNASGVYTGTVAAGWSGTATPTLAGYSFTPASRTYTGLTTDQTAQDYAAAYVISPIRQALIDLYNATNGAGWTDNSGWKNPPLYTDGFALPGTESNWYGVHTNGGTSLGINLSENHLVGTLPASIGTLTSLVSLNLHTNQLSGTLPAELGNLTNLTVLHLYENAFTGSLPSTLGNLTHLFQLKAHTNLLSGSIPTALGSMTALQWLDLSGNGFTGSLPTELGNLPLLQVLDAHNNSLSGELPDSLGGLTNLTSLLLSGNSFSGPIPTAWGGMGALEALYLNDNELSGSIPSSLGGLTHLIDLKLNDNELTGSIPSSFGGLTILTTLNLSNNHLEGVLPNEMGSLAYLQNLALFSNKLQGPVPTSLAALTNLSTSETAIGFNALYTTDGTLRTFLTSKDPDWAATQTMAPSGVTATSLDGATIMVSWLPIEFISYTGRYKVYMSQTSGGPYSQVGQTLDKTVASMNVTSLTPGQRYYFVVRTQTDVHVLNTNIVESKDSAEASAVAWMQVVHVSGTITSGGSPLADVVMSGFTVPSVTNASGVYTGTQASGWSGTVTPILAGYTFDTGLSDLCDSYCGPSGPGLCGHWDGRRRSR